MASIDITRALLIIGKLHEALAETQEILIELQEEVETFEHGQGANN